MSLEINGTFGCNEALDFLSVIEYKWMDGWLDRHIAVLSNLQGSCKRKQMLDESF